MDVTPYDRFDNRVITAAPSLALALAARSMSLSPPSSPSPKPAFPPSSPDGLQPVGVSEVVPTAVPTAGFAPSSLP